MRRSSTIRVLWIAASSACAGGFAAGLTIGIGAVLSAGNLSANPLSMLFGLFLLLLSGAVGAIFGTVIGFAPTLLFGLLLTAFRDRAPFSHWVAWALFGGGMGAVSYWNSLFGLGPNPRQPDWLAAWVAAGAVALATYRRLSFPAAGATGQHA